MIFVAYAFVILSQQAQLIQNIQSFRSTRANSSNQLFQQVTSIRSLIILKDNENAFRYLLNK